MERNCYNCIWHSDIGCTSWDCQEMSRTEARKILNRARWRDIEEEKPDSMTYVEVYVPWPDSEITDYLVETELYVDWRDFTHGYTPIRWWRPLPEKPKEEV